MAKRVGFRISELLLGTSAAERPGDAFGRRRHQALDEDVVANVEARPPGHLADVGESEARLPGGLRDLLRAGSIGRPLNVEKQDATADRYSQHGRGGRDPDGGGEAPRRERNDFAASGPADSLQHLRRAIRLGQGAQLALDLSRKRKLRGAGGAALQVPAEPQRLGSGQLAVEIRLEDLQRLLATQIVIGSTHDDTSRSRSRSLRRPRWRWT